MAMAHMAILVILAILAIMDNIMMAHVVHDGMGLNRVHQHNDHTSIFKKPATIFKSFFFGVVNVLNVECLKKGCTFAYGLDLTGQATTTLS
jgi:hypothetical protein